MAPIRIDSNEARASFDDLRARILERLNKGPHRQTPSDLIRAVRKAYPHLSAFDIKKIFQKMVQEGSLAYSHHFTITQLEPGFQLSGKITPHISLFPTKYALEKAGDKDGIVLTPGASFGAGDHPTTRLALKALDYLCHQLAGFNPSSIERALDIGTGSGILAIAATHLGIPGMVAIDSDPLACDEARRNIALNPVRGKIEVVCGTLAAIGRHRFGLIMANLRPPTLKGLFKNLPAYTSAKGLWLISGFRSHDFQDIVASMQGISRSTLWHDDLGGWSAVVVQLRK